MRRRWVLVPAILAAAAGAILVLGWRLPVARENARRKKCWSTLRSMGVAIHVYSTDHEDRFPTSFGQLYPRYVQDGHLFVCPTAQKATVFTDDDLPEEATDAASLLTDRYTDYEYVPGLNASLLPSLVLIYERPSNHGGEGSNVLFLNGQVRWLTPAELEKHLALTYNIMRQNGIVVPSATH